jgi:drug/metabolite transporter (DMT)-like permease
MPELLGGLISDLAGLFRKEIQLAKTEASEKVDQVVGASISLLFGGILALGALGVVLAALVTALAAFLVSMDMQPTAANSLAAAIVAVIVGGIAWMLISKGMSALKASNLMLNRTTHSLAQDADAVKEKF